MLALLSHTFEQFAWHLGFPTIVSAFARDALSVSAVHLCTDLAWTFANPFGVAPPIIHVVAHLGL